MTTKGVADKPATDTESPPMTAPDAPAGGDGAEVYWYVRTNDRPTVDNDGWHYLERAEALECLRRTRRHAPTDETFTLVRVTRRKVQR